MRAMRHRVLLFLLFVVAAAVHAQNPAVTINVDATANRHPIDPNVYGVNFATTTQLNDLNVPLNRAGGNAETTYNWQANASNRAYDWYFESIGDSSATAGERADTFIAASKAANAQAMVTIPMIGWVAKLGNNRANLASFSIAKYGAQQGNDWQWMPDAGNGVLANGSNVTNNDPNDANLPTDSLFQKAWVQHLVTKWGTAANGGLRYYLLDNEVSIWHSIHRDVHPTGATMEEIASKMIDYASRIKSVDSGAIVAGPEEWGWGGYLYSGYDQQYGAAHNWSSYPDRESHGDVDYIPYLLGQLHAYDVTNNKRLLDVLTVHYYPQSGEYSDDTSAAMQQLRNRSTRSLWDPNYTDESWIGSKVQLIPRLRGWVNTLYPGTKIGITEYSWGAESHMNGATAQADVLGIFGREGLDLATRWETPASSTPTYKAMKMYRNYDGAKSTFGDQSVSATAPNPDAVAAFAAVRSSDKKLTVMIVCKATSGTTAATINLSHYVPTGNAQRYQLASNAITHPADVTLNGSSYSVTLPAQSVTLLVVPGNDVAQPPTVAAVVPYNGTSAGGTSVTISGTNFVNGATVTIGGVAATNVVWNSSTVITAKTAAHAAGAANVTVTNPDAQSGTLTAGYAYYSASFTDDPLIPGASTIKAVHITELRSRINTLRSGRGLSAFSWTDASVTSGSTAVRAAHINDLREALRQVYVAAARTPPAYTDTTLTTSTTAKTAHIAEIRSAIAAIE